VARGVADRLGYVYVDTGAIYRAVAYLAMAAGLRIEQDGEAIGALAGRISVEFRRVEGAQHIFINGIDLEEKVRLPEVGAMSSPVSALPKVRESLLSVQRELARHAGCVVEGRDIGTVVLPDADVKIFLTASPEERARRRLLQLRKKHPDITFEEVLADQIERDRRDSSRDLAPLRKADDALEIVSDGMELAQVIEQVCRIAEEEEAETSA
jgi:CMP/dCMP kinase